MDDYKLNDTVSIKFTNKTTGETLFECKSTPTKDLEISIDRDRIEGRIGTKADIIYVVYLDNKMYTANGRKCAYLEPSGAKQVVTSDSKKLAEGMYEQFAYDTRWQWYDLTEDSKQDWIEKARARFEIREFAERR